MGSQNRLDLKEEEKVLVTASRDKLRLAKNAEGISNPILAVTAGVALDTMYAFFNRKAPHGILLSTYLRLVDTLGYELHLMRVKEPKKLEETPENLKKLQNYRVKKKNHGRKKNGIPLKDGKVPVRLPKQYRKSILTPREEFEQQQKEEDFLCSGDESDGTSG